MSGDHGSRQHPPRRRGVLLAILGLGGLGLLAIVGLAGRIWLGAVDDAPFDDGPVVVLGGGGGERLALGRALRGDTGRQLVLSADAIDRYLEGGGTCQDDDALCFRPAPLSTLGEAQAIGELVRTEDWTHVTVVTSDFHTLRTRLLFRQCVPVPVAVVAAEADAPVAERVYRVVRESVATVVALVRRC